MRQTLFLSPFFALVAALAAAAAGGCSKAATPCSPGAAGADTGDFPPSVSAYCMVAVEGGAVVPKAGVTPYDLNTPLFSDYAVKYRTVWVPPGASVPYAADGRFELPVGAVVTKSFGFPADFRTPNAPVKWVETRVLVHAADGWKGSSYVWDDAQQEAQLAPGGTIASPTFIDAHGAPQSPAYLVPSQAECKKCHANDGVMVTLGPSAAQLNRDFAYPGSPAGAGATENQLAHWARVGLLSGAPPADQAPKLPVYDDPATGDAAARARAYLHANCSYCHNGNGEARTSGLVLLDSETDPYALGVCKPPVAAGKAGKDQQYDVVPGHPEASILVTRMVSTAPSIAMPELGRSLEHVEAVDVVSAWIGALDGGCP